MAEQVPSDAQFTFDVVDGDGINDQLLEDCAKLFSENYGIWGALAGPSLAGKRVKMSGSRLRKQSVPQNSVLAVCFGGTRLLGHAFATVWKYDGGTVGWITQLVVDSTVRRRNIATNLLRTFKTHKLFNDVTAVGLVSSHPASVAALARYSNIPVEQVDLNFMITNAPKILGSTPINYLNNIKPSGRLFEENSTSGTVSVLFTQFYVDHEEPTNALNVFKSQGRWSLGELPEGYEFLIVVPAASK